MSRVVGIAELVGRLGYLYIDDLKYLYNTLVEVASKYTTMHISYYIAADILSLYYDYDELYSIVVYTDITPEEQVEANRVRSIITRSIVNVN